MPDDDDSSLLSTGTPDSAVERAEASLAIAKASLAGSSNKKRQAEASSSSDDDEEEAVVARPATYYQPPSYQPPSSLEIPQNSQDSTATLVVLNTCTATPTQTSLTESEKEWQIPLWSQQSPAPVPPALRPSPPMLGAAPSLDFATVQAAQQAQQAQYVSWSQMQQQPCNNFRYVNNMQLHQTSNLPAGLPAMNMVMPASPLINNTVTPAAASVPAKKTPKKKRGRKKKQHTGPSPEKAAAVPKTKKTRKKAVPTPLPPELAAFTYEHRACLTLGDEVDESAAAKLSREEARQEAILNGEDPDKYVGDIRNVAKFITVRKGKPNEKKFVLEDLNSSQLRQLSYNFGCRKVGSASMFDCRMEMARKITMGTEYDNMILPNASSTRDDILINTLLRIINAVFHPEFVTRYLELNDTKRRKELEQARGSSPLKVFWYT